MGLVSTAPDALRPGRLLTIGALVLLGALGGSGALWASGLQNTEIRACINTSDGHLYLASRCPGESLVWNQQGPPGSQGAQGPPGPPGASGAQGLPGPSAAVAQAAQSLKGGIAIAQTTSTGKKIGNVQAYISLCAAGWRVVGGGYSIASAVPSGLVVVTNQEATTAGKSGWSVVVLRPKGFTTLKIGVRAICVKTS